VFQALTKYLDLATVRWWQDTGWWPQMIFCVWWYRNTMRWWTTTMRDGWYT